MATCIMVASGLNFSVDDYLRTSPFKPMTVFQKGHIPPKNNPDRTPRPDSGFAVHVGEDDEATVKQQIHVALQFLHDHSKEIRRMKTQGMDNLLLNFAVMKLEVMDQSDYFSPELIAALARYGMGLVVSVVTIPKG